MIEIITYSFVIMLASLVGVFSIWSSVGKFIEKNLRFLVSFSAGVFLVISLTLGFEVIEHSKSIPGGLLWIIVGIILLWIVFKIIPSFHHHHDLTEHHTHGILDARRIIIGDAIHNVGDGVLIASAFMVNPSLGLIAATSVLIHELVQETSEFFVLKQAGYSTKGALAINFAVSSTILLGSVGSLFLFDIFYALEIPLLGISAGAFLVVVFHDIIPHSIRSAHLHAKYLHHVLAFVIGIAIMLFVGNIVAPHGHADDEHTDDEEHQEETIR